jgi:branched-chain amino acid transport system substrate-binding protein
VRLICGIALLASLGASSATLAADEKRISDGVVRIGVLVDLAGPYAYLSGEATVTAARMALEDFGGKVLGYPIELVHADHRNRPDLAAAQAREWFEAGRVDAQMDVTGGGPALAVAKVAARSRRIAVFNTVASSRLTNEACTPVTLHWAFDAYALAHVISAQMLRSGGDSWYFVTADWGLGHTLERETADMVRAAGGRVLGSSMHGMGITDFSGHMERAKLSGANVIGVVTVGKDFINAMHAAEALSIGPEGKQRLAAMLAYVNDIHILGLTSTQGLYLASSFYWDLNEPSRAWSKRFFERTKQMPNMAQAGVYTTTLHYLKAVQAAGTDATDAVLTKMREIPVAFFGKTGRVRADGRMVHDMYLFRVKAPAQSRGPWDYLELRATVPGDQAFRPLAASACPLVSR